MNNLNLSEGLIDYLLDLQKRVEKDFYLWIELDSFAKGIALRFDSRRDNWHCRFIIKNDLEELITIEDRLRFMYDEYKKGEK